MDGWETRSGPDRAEIRRWAWDCHTLWLLGVKGWLTCNAALQLPPLLNSEAEESCRNRNEIGMLKGANRTQHPDASGDRRGGGPRLARFLPLAGWPVRRAPKP